MTEFTGLDIEMALDTSYDEARLLVDGMLKHVFRSVQKNNAKDIEVVKTQFPHEDFVFPEETVVLKFSEGIKLLRDDGWGMDEEKHVDELEDLSTPAEIRLGELVKEKFNADYYMWVITVCNSPRLNFVLMFEFPTVLINSHDLQDPSMLCPTPTTPT